MAETAEQRKARIRKRLADAETPQKEVTRNVVAEPVKETTQELEGGEDNKSSSPPTTRKRPSNNQIKQRAIERRQSKPTNYKIHVLSALGLAIAIRVAALGSKAVLGGK